MEGGARVVGKKILLPLRELGSRDVVPVMF